MPKRLRILKPGRQRGAALGDSDGVIGDDGLLADGELHISVDDWTGADPGKDGKDLISVEEDGDNVSVDHDMKDLKEVLDKYGIEYDDTMEEKDLEKMLEDAFEGKDKKKDTEEAEVR